jgi:hypothetical protein
VEDGDITSFKTDKRGNLTATLSVRMQLKVGQDYILKLVLSGAGGVDVTYYTHIVSNESMHVKEQLDFVSEFSNALYDKDEAESIRQYLETDYNKTTNDLGNVDITSSFEALTYAQLNPQKVAEPVPTITDITQDVACVKLNYVVSATSSNDLAEYYTVTEDFKVRYTDTRMYLLSYERTMNSLYDPAFTSTSTNSLKLGITDTSDITNISNDTCELTAFVKNRELYYYDYSNSQIRKVFGYLQDDVTNALDSYDQHDIKLIRMDADGNLAFAVYGYVNRGRHEGENGILFYRYSKENNRLEEIAFIPSVQPFATLAEDMEQVVYMNDNNEIYLSLLGELYCIDMNSREVTSMMSGVTSDTIVSSADHHMVASLNDTEQGENAGITVRDLEAGTSEQIVAQSGEVLRVIGFVEDDLVYGRVRKKDIVERDSATTFYPIHSVEIVDMDGNLVKEYQPSGAKTYVMSADIKQNLVELSLAKKQSDTFVDSGNDYIMSSEDEENSAVYLDYTYSTTRYKELYMVFPNTIYLNTAPELATVKETRIDENRSVAVEGDESGVLRYFVYDNGNISESYNAISQAIEKADENGGGVVNSKQKTVWEKSAIAEYATIGDDIPLVTVDASEDSAYACVATVLALEGEQVSVEELKAQGGEIDELLNQYLDKEAVNLTGCTLDEVMYYIGQGHAVIARDENGAYVLLTSYNATLLKVVNPVSGEVERPQFAAMRKAFEDAGNVFFSYLK